MRKLLVILLLLLCCTCHAQISVIAHTGRAGNGNAASTLNINTTAATIIFVQVAQYDGVTFGTLTDNKSNTWTQLRVDRVPSTVANYIYYCINPTVGSSHTFTYTKTGSFCSINVIALGNTPTSSPIDQQAGTFLASGTSFQPGSITPGQNNEIIIASIVTGNTGGSVAVNSGFTVSDAVAFSAGVSQGAVMAYLIQTAAAAVNPALSWSSSAAAAGSQFSVKWGSNGGAGFFILTEQ